MDGLEAKTLLELMIWGETPLFLETPKWNWSYWGDDPPSRDGKYLQHHFHLSYEKNLLHSIILVGL